MDVINELAAEVDLGEIIASVELAAGLAASRHLGRRVKARLDPSNGAFSFAEPKGSQEVPVALESAVPAGARSGVTDGREAGRLLRASREAARSAREVLHLRLHNARLLSRAARYQDRIGRLETGTVARREGKDLIVNLGPVEGRLPLAAQSRHEVFNEGDLIRVAVTAVRPEEPPVLLSRTAPEVVAGVMERETPAIRSGEVSVRGVARLPGIRAKAAVSSNASSVDPVAACLGPRGATIRAVTRELRGERVDVLRWSDSMETFVRNALRPARVLSVELPADGSGAVVTVIDSELPRALGKRGQNVRLASELTGQRIEVEVDGQAPRRRREFRPSRGRPAGRPGRPPHRGRPRRFRPPRPRRPRSPKSRGGGGGA